MSLTDQCCLKTGSAGRKPAGPDLFCQWQGEAQVVNLLSLSSACQHVVNGKQFLYAFGASSVWTTALQRECYLHSWVTDWLDGTGRSLLGRCIMRSICLWPYPRIAFYLKRTEEGQGWPGSPSAVPWASVASEFVLPGPIETLHPVPAHQAGTPEHRAKFRKSLLCQGLTWDFIIMRTKFPRQLNPQKSDFLVFIKNTLDIKARQKKTNYWNLLN